MGASYTLYLLRCVDGTFYTGITTDVVRRVNEHNKGPRGAAYTRGRRPVTLVYSEECASRSIAQKREYVLRHLSHAQKHELSVKRT